MLALIFLRPLVSKPGIFDPYSDGVTLGLLYLVLLWATVSKLLKLKSTVLTQVFLCGSLVQTEKRGTCIIWVDIPGVTMAHMAARILDIFWSEHV